MNSFGTVLSDKYLVFLLISEGILEKGIPFFIPFKEKTQSKKALSAHQVFKIQANAMNSKTDDSMFTFFSQVLEAKKREKNSKMAANLNYYTIEEANNMRYYKMPKALFTDKRYKQLSDAAVILYSILNDRMALSIDNNWFDSDNHVFIIYTEKDIMELIGWSRPKVTRIMLELEEFGLIQRKRPNKFSAYRIYVMNLCSDTREQNVPSEGTKCSTEGTKCSPSKTNNIKTNRVIYAQGAKKRQNSFMNFKQRDIDMNQLEAALVNRRVGDSS